MRGHIGVFLKCSCLLFTAVLFATSGEDDRCQSPSYYCTLPGTAAVTDLGEGFALSPPVLASQLADFVLVHFLFALTFCAITTQIIYPITFALIAFSTNFKTIAFAGMPREPASQIRRVIIA